MERCALKRKFISFILTLTISLSLSSNAFAAQTTSAPKLVAKTAVAIDANTGELIYAVKPDTKVYPASTTKLLTALLLVEAKKTNDTLTYTSSAQQQPSASLNKDIKPIKVGEKITADNALKGLLIFSANDIAYMIANNLTGKPLDTVQETNNDFSVLMNKKVAALGLKNTHFVTANGLFDANHYTTAYDIGVIGKAAFANPWILNTVKQEKTVVTTESGLNLPITNRNKLILPTETKLYDQTCIGGKTGYLNEAGKCLVSIFNRNGKKIIGVVMDSSYDAADTQVFKDMEDLVNYSYSINYTNLYKSNSTIKTEIVNYKPLKFFGPTKTIIVPLILKDNVTYYKNSVNDSEKKLTTNFSSLNPWKLNADTPVGKLTLTERGVTKTYNLYTNLSTGELIKQNTLLYICTFVLLLVGVVFALMLLSNIVNLINKNKRRKNTRYR